MNEGATFHIFINHGAKCYDRLELWRFIFLNEASNADLVCLSRLNIVRVTGCLYRLDNPGIGNFSNMAEIHASIELIGPCLKNNHH